MREGWVGLMGQSFSIRVAGHISLELVRISLLVSYNWHYELMLSLRFNNFSMSLIIDFHQWLLLVISAISCFLNILVIFFVLAAYYSKRLYAGFAFRQNNGSVRCRLCSRDHNRPSSRPPSTISPIPPSAAYGLENNIYFSD